MKSEIHIGILLQMNFFTSYLERTLRTMKSELGQCWWNGSHKMTFNNC